MKTSRINTTSQQSLRRPFRGGRGKSATNVRAARAFTLIELLTVIAIIAVLMGLLFPAIGAIRETAKKTQAKNDLLNIVNAISAYYTEYGRYPSLGGGGGDITVTGGNNDLMDVLRGVSAGDSENPRRIVFLDAPIAKEIGGEGSGRFIAGVGDDGNFVDPWGIAYNVRYDGDYDNEITNPYTGGAGPADLRKGVIAWSLGKDGQGGSGTFKQGSADDDVISWQ